MFTKITKRLKENPRDYYVLSIAASWAGAGSLMNSATLANTLGIVPAAIWCLFNTLACAFFGLIIWKLPTVREIMRTKVCRIVLALFSIFQIWLCMTAIREAWASTILGSTFGLVMTYAVTAGFIIALFKKGILANIITDNGGMALIYILVFVLAVFSMRLSGLNMDGMSRGLDAGSLWQGTYKGLLLLPGPFTYPYFFKLLDYNEANQDGVQKVDLTRAFCLGGLAFGLYLLFAFALIFTEISPVLQICKAILLSALAISSLSSFLYSEYAVFGKKAGLGLNLFAMAFWIVVAPLGVMGVWTLMAESRVYLFGVLMLAALILRIRRKAVAAV